jgi:uncharacterized membrane protein YfcA
MHWQWAFGALCAFLLTLLTTPAGVSGAVLLLPIQLSILHVPSPALTPTKLHVRCARSAHNQASAPSLELPIDPRRSE